jgi:hypothetical protein
MFVPEPTIDCIDCGGECHLLTRVGEFGWVPGELLVYRCSDCNDRWDLLVPDPDDDV